VDWAHRKTARKKLGPTAYEFSAPSSKKRVLLEEFPNRSSGIMQAFALEYSAADKFSGCAGAPGRADLRVRFRGNEQPDFRQPV